MKVIFAGTPQFAVPSLEAIVQNGYRVCAVITAPDKPSGRGLKATSSPVKQAALNLGLNVFQPWNLKDEIFLNKIRSLDADVMVVIAFRMMPDVLWKIPGKGTFNLHASLLPQYRGAAPVNRAIMNGETETGLTTFFINETIDTGEIILRERVEIGPAETAGQLHDRLMHKGAQLVIETLKKIESGKVETIPQSSLISPDEKLKPAPKIFKTDCLINWKNSRTDIYNQVRGLCPHPAAYFELQTESGLVHPVKVFETRIVDSPPARTAEIRTDEKNYFHIACKDGWISIEDLQSPGKKRMKIREWLNGIKQAGLLKVSERSFSG